jgi:hypothetical protein
MEVLRCFVRFAFQPAGMMEVFCVSEMFPEIFAGGYVGRDFLML